MYIGNDLQVAESGNKIIDDISSSFNGSTTSFALLVGGAAPVPFPINTQQIYISVNGVIQEPDPTGSAGFKLLGNNIVFSSAPANGHAFFGVILSGADYVTVGTEFPAGSATAPSITFGNDNNTGLYSVTGGTMGFTSDGVQTFTMDGNGFNFPDNKKVNLGSSSDLAIWHSGSHSYIEDSGTGNLYIDANQLYVRNADTDNVLLYTTSGGEVRITHNGNEKIKTQSTGVEVTGTVIDDGATHDGDVTFTGAAANVTWDKSADDLIFADNAKAVFGTGGDLSVYHDGSNSYLAETGTGNLRITSDNRVVINKGTSESMAVFDADGAVELYHNNNKKFETTATGITITGNVSLPSGHLYLSDTQKLMIGTSDDLQIYHDPNAGGEAFAKILNTTGDLYIQNTGDDSYIMAPDDVYIKTGTDDDWAIKCIGDAGVELYHHASKKFETTSDGATVTGSLQVGGAGSGETDSKLYVANTGGNAYIQIKGADSSGTVGIKLGRNSVANRAGIDWSASDDALVFRTGGTTEKLRITSAGRLGLGYNNPDETNGGAGFITRVTPVTRNQYYSPAGQYAASFGLVSDTNTKMWIAVDSSYAQSSAVSAGILLRAFHQDAGGSSCGYTIKNLNNGNPLVFSSVVTAASTNNPAVETERMRITSTGNVGIGTTNPGCLLEVNTADNSDNHAIANFSGTDVGNAASFFMRYYTCGSDDNRTGFYWQHENVANVRMWMGDDGKLRSKGSNPTSGNDGNAFVQEGVGANNIKMNSGEGINFSAYATSGNPNSNLLDDYEEGQWTPNIVGYWSSAWRDATHDGAVYGRYVKVGKLCFIYGYLDNVEISGNAVGTNAAIYGLPFTSANTSYGATINVTHSNIFDNCDTGNFYVNINSTVLFSSQYGDNVYQYCTWSGSDTRYMMFSGCYHTA